MERLTLVLQLSIFEMGHEGEDYYSENSSMKSAGKMLCFCWAVNLYKCMQDTCVALKPVGSNS